MGTIGIDLGTSNSLQVRIPLRLSAEERKLYERLRAVARKARRGSS